MLVLSFGAIWSNPRTEKGTHMNHITPPIINRKKASDFPQDLLNMLDGYVHGRLNRREFMDACQKYAVGGVTAAALFEMLKPNYAWAIQVPADDKRIKGERVEIPSPQGNGSIKGYLVKPANAAGKLPVVLVVHENRGLNPYVEDVARRLATANFVALAPDGLTSVGGYPGDDEKGGMLFSQKEIKELPRLERFDLDFDLPDHFLPEFPPAIFLTTRPDLGDVSQGKVLTTDNFQDIFRGILNSKDLEGVRSAWPVSTATSMATHRRRRTWSATSARRRSAIGSTRRACAASTSSDSSARNER